MATVVTLAEVWDLLDRNLSVLERMEQLEYRYEDRRGETYPNTLNLKAGQKIIKLDFIRGEHQNLPLNESVDIPSIPVSKCVLYNEGNPTDSSKGIIGFSTSPNLYVKSDTNAGVMLRPGENFEVSTPRPTIARLNLVAPFYDTVVRIILIV